MKSVNKDLLIDELREALKQLLEETSEYRGTTPPNATPEQIHHEQILKRDHEAAVRRGKLALRNKFGHVNFKLGE